MKRRKLLNRIAVSASGAGMLTACSKGTQFDEDGVKLPTDQPKIKWRMATSWQRESPRFAAMKDFSDLVRKVTHGNFEIAVFPGGGIAPKQKILSTIESGTVECGSTLGLYYLDRSPTMALDAALPFGLDENQYEIWLYGSGGLEKLRQVYAEFNIINFAVGETGKQMGGWFKKKVQSLADLQGLKMRFPGIGGQVVERLGVEIVDLPLSDIRTALERSEIEAAEITGPFEDEKLRVHEVAPYYYYPGWQQPRATISLYVNKTAWEKLPEPYQIALEMASAVSYRQLKADSASANGAALERLKASGVEVLPFPPDILNAVRETTNEVFQEYTAQDTAFREIYSHETAFVEEYFTWAQLTLELS